MMSWKRNSLLEWNSAVFRKNQHADWIHAILEEKWLIGLILFSFQRKTAC